VGLAGFDTSSLLFLLALARDIIRLAGFDTALLSLAGTSNGLVGSDLPPLLSLLARANLTELVL
jgi:hypothetical protein